MKTFRHALLIGNAKPLTSTELKPWIQQADFVLAADGGANRALQAGIRPHAVIGDLDSVSSRTRQKLPAASWIFVDNQNNTDLEKSLTYLCTHGCKRCTLVGFSGGRMDFTLGNLLALYPYAGKMDLCVIGDGWKIYPLRKRKTFTVRPGARISLLPLTPCRGVTLTGLEFPLTNTRLPLGTTRTLSNRAVKSRFTVRLQSGLLLVYVED
ncbi:MAG: thiamine diphosphokinase [Elusimicrobiaceae bacterium]|nr:thiamine diphosphokinase [Elusimicrobiaceae bacterium]